MYTSWCHLFSVEASLPTGDMQVQGRTWLGGSVDKYLLTLFLAWMSAPRSTRTSMARMLPLRAALWSTVFRSYQKHIIFRFMDRKDFLLDTQEEVHVCIFVHNSGHWHWLLCWQAEPPPQSIHSTQLLSGEYPLYTIRYKHRHLFLPSFAQTFEYNEYNLMVILLVKYLRTVSLASMSAPKSKRILTAQNIPFRAAQ
jgi:hypothetical protein